MERAHDAFWRQEFEREAIGFDLVLPAVRVARRQGAQRVQGRRWVIEDEVPELVSDGPPLMRPNNELIGDVDGSVAVADDQVRDGTANPGDDDVHAELLGEALDVYIGGQLDTEPLRYLPRLQPRVVDSRPRMWKTRTMTRACDCLGGAELCRRQLRRRHRAITPRDRTRNRSLRRQHGSRFYSNFSPAGSVFARNSRA